MTVYYDSNTTMSSSLTVKPLQGSYGKFVAALTNLKPSTRYYFSLESQIFNPDSKLAGSFLTLPAKLGSKADFSIIVVGDCKEMEEEDLANMKQTEPQFYHR